MSFRQRMSYANVVSTLALVLTMSTGGAYAAGLITTSQIADGAVTTPKLRREAVTAARMAQSSVTTPKICDGAVTTSKIGAGAVAGWPAVEDGTIRSVDLANGTLLGEDVANGTLTGQQVADGSIERDDLDLGARRPGAFATVKWDGTVDPYSPSSGLTSEMITPVSRIESGTGYERSGIYCLHDLPFHPIAVSATPTVGPSLVTVGYGRVLDECPVGTQLTVRTYFRATNQWFTHADWFIINIWP